MYIKTLTLINFRNYCQSTIEFDRNLNVIIGKNGIGKTNILESIYFLTFGKSWKTLYDYEVISYSANYSNIKAEITNSKKNNLFVGIERGFGNNSKKVFKINEVKKTVSGFTNELKSITFSPSDLEIILLSPTIRRRFLDEILLQTDDKYKKYIIDLKKIVTNRNKILKRIKEGVATYDEMEFWNIELIEKSTYIQKQRQEVINFINSYLKVNFINFSNTKSSANIIYKKSACDKNKLINYRDIEIITKRTLFGAQKDDFDITFLKDNKTFSSKYFASRGEQRSITFVLKLGALNYIQQQANTKLVLLLDDIYSELDETHRVAIGNFIKNNQTIITTAEESLVPKEILNKAKITKL